MNTIGVKIVFLRKITGIRSVGRFKAPRIGGGYYGRFTLFYGGNGRGKTTLCAILRSLQRNDPKLILRRKSFQAMADSEVNLLLDIGTVRFSGGTWNASQPDIHIFDHQFVNENVHGGDQIDVEHRRNFYRIVVGPTGVTLAEEVDRLDAETTAKQGEIATQKKVLEQHVPIGMAFDAFLKLGRDADVDLKIETSKKSLLAINNADAITKRKLLSTPPLPALPDGFETLLAKSVDGIASDATLRVQEHLDRHDFHNRGEGWLAEGLEHIHDDRCPFCATSLQGNSLIAAYKGFFSEAYADFVNEIIEMKEAVKLALASNVALTTEQAFTNVASDAAFWNTYCDCRYETPPAASRIATELEALFGAAEDLINAKADSPLDVGKLSARFIEGKANWAATSAELNAATMGFAEANVLIQAVKDANATANKAQVEADLAALEAVKKRYTEPVANLALHFDKLQSEKKNLVDEKDAKKKALDAYDATILGQYQDDINRILSVFGASFRLAQCGKNYIGKLPQSTYCLRFDNNDVDVTKTGSNDPDFDTTMSAGDKSTFALAFFLAQLRRDPHLARKLVVFDDPFTSLDDFRRAMTAKEIVRIGADAAQTIVLSHDKHFLDTVRNLIHGQPCSTMQLSGTSGGSSIEEWDIDWEVKEGYLQDHMRLQEFAEGISGDAREMRTVMRPLVEKYIRFRFPNQIPDGKWLGDMLAVIRNDNSHPLFPQYNELDDINTYTAPFHHDPNTPFNEDEVRTCAQRTVAIVGGC